MTDTDTPKGSAGRAMSQRVVDVVHMRTRRGAPLVERTGVVITAEGLRTRDDTAPSQAIALARSQDRLVQLPHPTTGRACLTIPDRVRLARVLARHDDPAVVDRLREWLADADLPDERAHRGWPVR